MLYAQSCVFTTQLKLSGINTLLQCSTGESWQDKACFVDSSVVVAAQLLLLFWGPFADRLAEIAIGVLTAYHESNLARWVCRNGGIGVFDVGEYFFAVLLELSDQWEVEPLVLGYEKRSVSIHAP